MHPPSVLPPPPPPSAYLFGGRCTSLSRRSSPCPAQRERGSLDSSPRSDDGRAERRDSKLLHEIAAHSTCREPADRPSAWGLLVRLQRHAGEDVARCHDVRTLVPLSAPLGSSTPVADGQAAALAGPHGRGSPGASGSESADRSRDGSRSPSADKRKRRRPHDEQAELKGAGANGRVAATDERPGGGDAEPPRAVCRVGPS